MSFNPTNFYLSSAGPSVSSPQFTYNESAAQVLGFQWGYTTTDSNADVNVSHYFDSATVRAGDKIYVTASDGYSIYEVYQSFGSPTTVSAYRSVAFSGTTSVWPA